MERVVVRQGGEAAVGLEHHRHLERLEADLGQPEVEVFQDPDVAERGAHQPLGAQLDLGGAALRHLVDELLRHRRDGAEVDADPDRRPALLGAW